MPLFFLFIVFLSLTNIAELLVFFKNNLIYLYISSVLLSLQMIFLAWHNSIGNYKKISLSRIMQSLVVSCLPILIYPLQLASKALIYAQILSLLVSLFVLCRGISFNLAGGVRLFWVIKKFYKNSVIGVPHILFDVMGSIALTSAISKNYGDEVLGYFNIAQRFKNIVSTIGSSYGIMFNEKISKVKNNSYFIKINHLKSLIFPMILIYFGFQFLDSFIIKLFGEKWTIAVEMAREVGLPVDKVKQVIKITKEPVSLEAPIGSDDDGKFGDFVPDEKAPTPVDNIMKEDLQNQIDQILGQLNEREQAVIRMRFGLMEDASDRTLEEIGKELSVTRERVRQIESSAIKKLKHPKVGKNLKNYVES